MYLLAILIPVQFCTYITIGVFDIFVPIMGRAGTETPPDVFIAVLCSFAVVMFTSYVVSTYRPSPVDFMRCTEII